jgi:hypothetical protein
MRHTTKSSWTTARLEELGRVTARCLDSDSRMADLATEMRDEVQKLALATMGARSAHEEVRYFREQWKQAGAKLGVAVRDAEMDVRKAAAHDVGSGLYRVVFPDGLTGILYGAQFMRVRKTKALQQSLADSAGMEPVAKALAAALAAFEAADVTYQGARSKALSATKAAGAARDAFLAAYRVAQGTVLGRLKDAKAAAALFPDLRSVVAPTADPRAGDEPVVPSPAIPPAPPSPAHADAA